MVAIIYIVAAFVGILGVAGLVRPAALKAFASRFRTKAMIHLASMVRLIIGAGLVVAASATRYPMAVQILGAAIILAGVFLPFLSQKKIDALLDWYQRQPAILTVLSAIVALAMAAFLVYATL